MIPLSSCKPRRRAYGALRGIVALSALLATGAAPAPAQARRMDITDLGRIVRVAEPQISPDGRSIVVIVSRPNYDDDRYDEQFDVVLRHAFLALQVGGQALAEAGGGSMVFIGSVSGQEYLPNQALYGAAKAALHRLVDLRPGRRPSRPGRAGHRRGSGAVVRRKAPMRASAMP